VLADYFGSSATLRFLVDSLAARKDACPQCLVTRAGVARAACHDACTAS
jgi:hypothetical protein